MATLKDFVESLYSVFYLCKLIKLFFYSARFYVVGEIVFWTIIRTAITIAGVWILKSNIDDQLWYIIIIAAVYLIIIHPTVIGLKKFDVKSKNILDSTICSNCVHFDPSAVLCIKHDKHPTEDYIPCDGIHWEPK